MKRKKSRSTTNADTVAAAPLRSDSATVRLDAGELSEEIDRTLPTAPSGRRGTANRDAGIDDRIGSKLGRYVIVDKIGAGGMGVVYKAYDPELDRRVALKLLTAGESGSMGSTDAQARLLREAQALARLQHPNVVSVHDVGVVKNEVFVAMEYVEGSTIKKWLAKEQRTLPEILRVFRAAGRGLSAAHEAGLIHRDFKPANVMVGDDGRIRVLDFGLARTASDTEREGEDEEGEEADEDFDSSSGDSNLSKSLTVAGSVMGTPPYMAAEQHRGESVDARTDQFAFCVSVFEALYGQRPFRGKTNAAIKRAVLTGQVGEPSSALTVPQRVRKVLLRGLSASASERYPTMDALLADLPERVANRGRQLVVALVGVAIITAAIFTMTQNKSVKPACDGGEAKLLSVWSPVTAKALQGLLADKWGPRGAETARRVGVGLDKYKGVWLSAHQETCEATHIRGEQSATLLDLRMACLDRKLDKVVAFRRTMEGMEDSGDLDLAMERVHQLPSSAVCENTELLQKIDPIPEDSELLQRIGKVRALVDAVEINTYAGTAVASVEETGKMMEEALAIGYMPVIAEMRFAQAMVQAQRGVEDAEPIYILAAQEAANAGDDYLLARVWIEMSLTLGIKLSRFKEGKTLLSVAGLAVKEAKGTDTLEGRRLQILGRILREEANYDEAEEVLVKSLASYEKALGPGHPEVATALNHLASLYEAQGKYQKAQEAVERVIPIFEESLGPNHMITGKALNDLGNSLFSLGKFEQARESHERSLQIRTKASGGVLGNSVASSHTNLGNVATAQGRFDDALVHQTHAYKIFLDVLPDNHPDIATALHNIGNVYVDSARYEQALAKFDEAIQVRSKSQGMGHPFVAVSMIGQGDSYYGLKKFTEAESSFSRALEILSKTLGPEHPFNAYAATGLARTLLALKRAKDAVVPAELALKLRTGVTMDPGEQGDTRWVSARILWELGEEKRARELAELAKTNFETAGAKRRKELSAVTSWLKSK